MGQDPSLLLSIFSIFCLVLLEQNSTLLSKHHSGQPKAHTTRRLNMRQQAKQEHKKQDKMGRGGAINHLAAISSFRHLSRCAQKVPCMQEHPEGRAGLAAPPAICSNSPMALQRGSGSVEVNQAAARVSHSLLLPCPAQPSPLEQLGHFLLAQVPAHVARHKHLVLGTR